MTASKQRVIYLPVDVDLLEDCRYYWCSNRYGGVEPSIVFVSQARGNESFWVISDGDPRGDTYLHRDPAKSDFIAAKLFGPIPVPLEVS